MNEFQKKITQFAHDRDWNQFHNPKDLLLGIVEEVGELRNLIKWEQDPKKIQENLLNNKEEFEDNIGDLYWFLALLANSADVNIDTAISKVIERNEKRFPVEKVRSQHTNVSMGGFDNDHREE